MIIYKSYKYRLETNNVQRQGLSQIADSCRFIWNWALQQRNDLYKALTPFSKEQSEIDLFKQLRKHHRISAFDQHKQITYLRKQFPFLMNAPIHSLQAVIFDLDSAFQYFFSKQNGYPKFKKKTAQQSFRLSDPQYDFTIDNGRIRLAKIGWLSYKNSRSLRGRTKSVTVLYDGLHWFISILTEQDIGELLTPVGQPVAIDLGVTRSVAQSDNETIQFPMPTKPETKKLAKLQRHISRKQVGSNRRTKAQKRFNRLKKHLTNRRLDKMHKTTTKLAKNHSLIVIEDLQVKNMSKSAKGTIACPGVNVAAKSGLNKAILQQGWYEFRRQLTYKTQWYGSKLEVVPAPYTSQTCSQCQYCDKGNRLAQELFKCLKCGYAMNADVNAAQNILAVGMTVIARRASQKGEVQASIVDDRERSETESLDLLVKVN